MNLNRPSLRAFDVAAHLVVAVALLGLPMLATAISVADQPLFLAGGVPPRVVLNISKDHQLYYKAYNDYTDLNGDGTIQTTYQHSYQYYGYFDSAKCYTYNTSLGRFQPAALVDSSGYCNGQWNGNFLNWATMTRMDVLRKVLYGGKRVVDTVGTTVLERSYLPTDAHAFAKYYNGSDISKLTPYSNIANRPPTVTSGSTVKVSTGTVTFSVLTGSNFQIGDQVQAQANDNSGAWMVGAVTLTAASPSTITITVPNGGVSGTGVSSSTWTLTNLTATGISICNLTAGDNSTSSTSSNTFSQTNTNPPLMRVAAGNYALWSANERWQCYWSEVKSYTQKNITNGFLSNGNQAALSGINASAENPSQGSRAIGSGSGSGAGEFNVRVEVCNSTLVGSENCKGYTTGNGTISLKPAGLLQKYGDDGQIYFALFTGTFDRNVSGGVLRKAMGGFNTELDTSTGIFNSSKSPAGSSPLVSTLDSLRMYGYSYSDGTYNGLNASQDKCDFQRVGIEPTGTTPLTNEVKEGNCASWGNPMSELYLESLRYLAFAKSGPNTQFSQSPPNHDAALNLPQQPWSSDPLSQSEFCAPLTVLNVNPGISSYDGDQIDGPNGFADLGSSLQAVDWTNKVGDLEGITGQNWFIGDTSTLMNDLCSSKPVSQFGSIKGLCPEGPSLRGTYLMAGIAYYAHTNRIRSDLTVSSTAAQDFPDALKVTTYGVALATNVPRISITVGGKQVVVVPAYRLSLSDGDAGPFGGGTLVDFKIISQTPTHGQYYVNWEDSGMGGDYDQDMWGILTYDVIDDSTVRITTTPVSASSFHGQGFGYVISGTTADGPHFHTGIYNFVYTDPIKVTVKNLAGVVLNGASNSSISTSGGCNKCSVTDPATYVEYTATGNPAGNLKDPLWYAAKYGGFNDSNGNSQPDLVSEWDANGDGLPDTFVFATDPNNLVNGLAQTFDKISKRTSSSASLATNSTQLSTDTEVFQARFDSKSWSGTLVALPVQANGVANGSAPTWDSAKQLPAAASRNIYTFNGSGGLAFNTFTALTVAQQAALNTNPVSNLSDGLGANRLAWLRGDRTQEIQNGGALRNRTPITDIFATTPLTDTQIKTNPVMGDIINSDPFYVGQQYFAYDNTNVTGAASYRAYFDGNGSRTPMVYVGANDGMLHGFNAKTGVEVLAYLPNVFFGTAASPNTLKLSQLTKQGYTHTYYVDGGPYAGDAYFASDASWHTVLVSGLGAGGKSVFALDVTDPAGRGFAASNVLWEFTDTNLCYTFSEPRIGVVHNGNADQWVAIFGNGYQNVNDTVGCGTQAYLYVLDLQKGTLLAKIATNAGTSTTPNGLSTPTLVDYDGDGYVDHVYAGDLLGNLWEFDFTNSNPGNWASAFKSGSNPAPFFIARDSKGNAQPITSAPEVGTSPQGGLMVYVGTGQYINTADTTNLNVQTFYGLHDPVDGKTNISATNRSTLVAQTYTQTTGFGQSVRVLSANTVDYTKNQGWYMDLVPQGQAAQGERVVTSPLLRFDRVIFDTLIPSTDRCSFGGTSWLMEANALSGGNLGYSVFDLSGNGLFNSGDYVNNQAVGGLQSAVGITKPPVVISAGAKEYKLQGGTNVSKGNNAGLSSVTEKGSGKPRASWRQIIAP